MSTVSDIITAVRYGMNDETASTLTDAKILHYVKESVRRTNRILCLHRVKFAKSSTTYTTTIGIATYALPADFGAQDGLYRDDLDLPVEFITDDAWERINTATQLTVWRINGTNIEVFNTPTQAIDLVFYYWPNIDTSAYTTATTMPWSGRADDIVSNYTILRLKHTDDYQWDTDLAILEDMSTSLLRFYQAQDPGISGVDPWLEE